MMAKMASQMPTNGSVRLPDALLKARPRTWGTRRAAQWAKSPDRTKLARLRLALPSHWERCFERSSESLLSAAIKHHEALFLRHTSRDHTVFDSEECAYELTRISAELEPSELASHSGS